LADYAYFAQRCQQDIPLLRTLPAIDREVHGDDDHVSIIMDMPGPVRD
jgi:hypothetical protein